MGSIWTIELFGGLRASQGDRTLTRFEMRRVASLLAFLGYYAGREHSRETLIEMLWPELDPDAGRNRFSVVLSSLRRELEPPGTAAGSVLLTDRVAVRLNPEAVRTDVQQFMHAIEAASRADDDPERAENLARAVELYQGPLLPGYYEEWVAGEQARLADRFFNALAELVTLTEAAGDVTRAVEYARQAVRVDPLREEAHRELMRLYAASGQTTAALRHYKDLERLLEREVGSLPSETTRSFMRQIRQAAAVPSADVPAANRRPQRPVPTAPPGLPPPRYSAPMGFLSPPPAPARAPQLPSPLSRFFGREEEIAQLTAMLSNADFGLRISDCPDSPIPQSEFCIPQSPRLVTLTGPGGAGKTRLAIQVAAQLVSAYERMVWFVPLAELRDPGSLPEHLMQALGLPPSPGIPPEEQIAAALSPGPALLVLDNFEQLAAEGALWLGALLERAATVRCLVTSRHGLRLTGEREFRVQPLPVPGRKEGLLACPSTQLLLDRAQAVRPDFRVTEGNAAAVAQLCERLEGIPLALELAAARLEVLTPEQLLTQFADRLDFLTRREPGGEPRHRTLRATLDWSYQLLSPDLQQLLARLAVFGGGWSLSAATAIVDFEPANLTAETQRSQRGTRDKSQWEKRSHADGQPATSDAPPTSPSESSQRRVPFGRRLCGEAFPSGAPKSTFEGWKLLDRITQLRRCSLVIAEEVTVPGAGDGPGSPEMRFRMLDTVREYAGQQLALEDAEALRRRHRDWFLALAEESETQLFGPDRTAWLQRLEREHDNFRAAVSWSFERDEFAEGLRLATALWPFLLTYGYRNEAREWLRAGSAGADRVPPEVRARLLLVQGHLARHDVNCEYARTCYAESRALFEALGDEFGVTRVVMGTAVLAITEEDSRRARELFAECADRYRELGRRPAVALCLDALGGIAYYEGDLETARRYWEEALSAWQELNSRHGMAAMFNNLGLLAGEQHDFQQARSLFERCLAAGREFQEPIHVATSLGNLAALCADEGHHEEACALSEEAVEIWRRMGERHGLTEALCSLGRSLAALGNVERARAYLEESFLICSELADRRGLACALEEFARLYAPNEPERAVQLFGAAASFRDAIRAPQLPRERSSHAAWLESAERRLGAPAFHATLAQGRSMSAHQAIARARLAAHQPQHCYGGAG